jgi:pimeloyl-ACP methyl ester carboxylesterase
MFVQKFLDARDGKFSYLDWGGDGPAAHIAHATGFCAGSYTPLAQLLVSRLKVVGMDYRGHGQTTAKADPATLRNWDIFAEDLSNFFSLLSQPVVAIGHSLGAVTSMLVAAKYPALVKALILVDPTILPQYKNLALFTAQQLRLTKIFPIVSTSARRTSRWPSKKTVLEAYAKRAPFNRWSDGFLDAYVEHGFEDVGPECVKLRCEPKWESKCFSTCPAGIWKIPRLLKIPVLVIYGANSDVFSQKSARKFQQEVPAAVLRAVDDASHFVPMERPLQTSRIIFAFLKEYRIL